MYGNLIPIINVSFSRKTQIINNKIKRICYNILKTLKRISISNMLIKLSAIV